MKIWYPILDNDICGDKCKKEADDHRYISVVAQWKNKSSFDWLEKVREGRMVIPIAIYKLYRCINRG